MMGRSPADSNSDTDPVTAHGSSPSTPRWVKAFGIVGLVLIVLLVVLILVGGGSHGPGRHTGRDTSRGHTPPSSGSVGEPAPAEDEPSSIALQRATSRSTWRPGDPGAVEYTLGQAGHDQADMPREITVT